jgi:hypothetical protein
VVADGFASLNFLGTDGTNLYAINGTDTGVELLRITPSGAISRLDARGAGQASFAVTDSALAWSEGDPTGQQFTVFTMPKSGGSPTARATIPAYTGALADSTSLFVLTTNADSIATAPLAGGDLVPLVNAPAHARLGFAAGDAIYYLLQNNLYRQPKTGGNATLITNLIGPVAYDDTTLYVLGNGELTAMPLVGGASRQVATWPKQSRFYAAPKQMTTDGDRVYFIDQLCANNNQQCGIRAVPVGGGTISTLCSSIEIPLFILSASDGVYVVDGGTIIRLGVH